MGCLWRSSKSRLVTKINNANNNQQKMNLRPSNVSPSEWRKFVKEKTSPLFQAVSESYKKRRAKQIPHTCSRKGMVRLTEELKKSSEDPSEVSRLQVWVKSRTRKDGTPVNTIAAEKFKKAAELVDMGAPSAETNPGEDTLYQLLGPDNPGRLRAMGRSMSKTKLACFQVKQKCMAEMEKNQVHLVQKVYELQDEIEKLKKQQEPDVGENSAARSVNKRTQTKCVLIDWEGTDEHVAKGLIIPSSPEEIVNGTLLGPTDIKVLIESVIKPEAFLWRPATNMFRVKEAVGELIAWSANHYVLLDHLLQAEDNVPTGSSSNPLNKCKLLDLSADDVVVAEGRWHTNEAEALVNGIPLGSGASKVFVDVILQPETFIWRPTKDITYLEDCAKSFVSWPAKKVVLENTTDARGHTSSVQKTQSSEQASGRKVPPSVTISKSPTDISQGTGQKATEQGSTYPTEKSPDLTVPKATAKAPAVKGSRFARKQTQQTQGSPLRRSQRNNNSNTVAKENQMCRLMDVENGKRIVAEGLWISNDPDQSIHCVRLGDNGVKVLVKAVAIPDADVWKPSSAIECMEDALGTWIAWPEDKVVMV